MISGGHLTPALAVMDYAKAHGNDDKVVFLGRVYSQPALKQRSWEKPEVTKRGATFVTYDAPKLDGQPFWKYPVVALQMLKAIWRAYRLLRKHKPDVFVSFGGFLAVPVAIAASFAGVPVFTHEQTRTGGAANAMVGKFAQVIAISFPETKEFFAKDKVYVTGNPLRQQLFEKNLKQPSWLAKHLSTKPLLYITGGNQGSQAINVLVQEGLSEILQDWWVIHQCGSPTTVMNYKKSLEKARTNLPAEIQENYYIREWVTDDELGWIYQHCDGLLSRSGANTVTECMALGKPAVFIPLPQAHLDEQRKNAEVMSEANAAMILLQKDASTETLVKTLKSFRRKLKSMTQNAEELKDTLPAEPNRAVYELIHALAEA